MIVVGYNRTNVNAFEDDRQAQLIVSINEPTQVNLFENSFYLLVNTQDETATGLSLFCTSANTVVLTAHTHTHTHTHTHFTMYSSR